MRADFKGYLLLILGAVATAAAPVHSEGISVRLAIVAPAENTHAAWAAAEHLQSTASDQGVQTDVETASVTDNGKPLPDLILMPVRSLATRVPALQVLELPFFYSSVSDLHQSLDGTLGETLVAEARKNGWEIVAFWDEGMHILSGIKRYDRVRNLKAREFLITRPDPVATKQFTSWKAYARRIDPQDRQAVLRECQIASRAATLQEVVREQLYRVHLSMSLTYHRYEGWVVIAPADRWAHLDAEIKEKLRAALRETTAWQRDDARQREATALAELKRRRMNIYEVDAEEREAFRKLLPDWADLLSDELDTELKRQLIGLASSGAAVVSGPDDPAPTETHRDPLPGAPAR